MTSNANIAVIGLGCVGLPLAVEFGKQRPVLGFDINQAPIAELQSGQDHTLEVSPAGFTYASDSNTLNSAARPKRAATTPKADSTRLRPIASPSAD